MNFGLYKFIIDMYVKNRFPKNLQYFRCSGRNYVPVFVYQRYMSLPICFAQ